MILCSLKQEGLKQEVLALRTSLGQSNSTIHELHHDIHDVVQSIQASSPATFVNNLAASLFS
jgi:hypothetical protein